MDSLAETIKNYDQTATNFAKKNYAIELTQQQQHFLGILPAGATQPLLDLGCGPGRDTEYFMAQGRGVVGADLSAGMLVEAQRRVPAGKFVQANMLSLPFAAEAFAGVWACASLLHLPRATIMLALAEMHRVLAPDGALFLGVQRGNGEDWRENPETGLRFFFTYYLPSELWDIVTEANFAVEAIAENTSTTNLNPDGNPVRWINLYARKP